MSKTTQNRKGPQHVHTCKNDVAIEEAKLVFEATWEAVMSASDEDLDTVLAAMDASKAAPRRCSPRSLLKARASKEDSDTTLFAAFFKGTDKCKLGDNVKFTMDYLEKGGAVVVKKSTRAKCFRMRSSVSHMMAKFSVDEDRNIW